MARWRSRSPGPGPSLRQVTPSCLITCIWPPSPLPPCTAGRAGSQGAVIDLSLSLLRYQPFSPLQIPSSLTVQIFGWDEMFFPRMFHLLPQPGMSPLSYGPSRAFYPGILMSAYRRLHCELSVSGLLSWSIPLTPLGSCRCSHPISGCCGHQHPTCILACLPCGRLWITFVRTGLSTIQLCVHEQLSTVVAWPKCMISAELNGWIIIINHKSLSSYCTSENCNIKSLG